MFIIVMRLKLFLTSKDDILVEKDRVMILK